MKKGGNGDLAFHQVAPGGGAMWDQWTVPVQVDGTGLRAGEPEPFLKTKEDERELDFSPDGQWVVYTSTEAGGRHEVFARAFPDDGRRWQASARGGIQPRWSPGRLELFYQAEGLLTVVPYSTNRGVFTLGKPRVWSSQPLPHPSVGGSGSYSVSPDGRRVVALVPDSPRADHSRQHVTLWVNAVAEFRRRMPIDR